ncbi:MAG: hypothetical protein ACFCGT_07545 [Sandaracinaceae bacterium]
MGFVSGLWLVALGVLASASLVIARRPDAADYLAKVAPYQGWIGAASAAWGVWMVVYAILVVGLVGRAPVTWLTLLATALLLVGLGGVLGVGVLRTFVRDEEALERLDRTIARLSPMQGTLGLVAVGLGLWLMLVGFLGI